jgi:hypothetical protein
MELRALRGVRGGSRRVAGMLVRRAEEFTEKSSLAVAAA